jgi:hypothetical protein
MKTYKKVLIAIGALVLDFLITYYGVRLAIYLEWTPGGFVDIWTVILLMIFGTPFALAAVIFIAFMLFKIVRNIYIHIKYGLEHTDQDNDGL